MPSQTLEEMRVSILKNMRGLVHDAEVLWSGDDQIRFNWIYNRSDRFFVSINRLLDGFYDHIEVSTWNEHQVVHCIMSLKPQIHEYMTALRNARTQADATGFSTTGRVLPWVHTPTPREAPFIPVATSPVASPSAPKQKQPEVKSVATPLPPPPKPQANLPKAFRSLDLPSPQEAFPVTPFTPRANPETYKSVQYRTKPKSRASFHSGKTPWTIPSLEMF